MKPSGSSKKCPACGRTLSAAAFNDSARSADGLASRCRACTNARRRQRDRGRKQDGRPAGKSARLAKALREGDIGGVRKLIRGGPLPSGDWICETMRGGHLALAEFLVASGVKRNVFVLAAMGDLHSLKRLLRHAPADARCCASMWPESIDVTPLHVGSASDWGACGDDRVAKQLTLAKLLYDHGADLSASARYRGLDGATPLLCACWTSGNVALVRWLLDQGAKATDRDLAAALGHFQRHKKSAPDIGQVLLDWGLPVDGSLPGDRTLLQAAAHQGVHGSVAWLLSRGACVNARGPGGRTAAHLAAERNTGTKTLALLSRAGADLTARDDDGHTPLDLARLNGKPRLVQWLKRRLKASR